MAKKDILKDSLIEYKQLIESVKESSEAQVSDILSEAIAKGLKNIITEADDYDVEDVESGEEEKDKDEEDTKIDSEDLDVQVDNPEVDGDVDAQVDTDVDAEDAEMDTDVVDGDEDEFDIESFKDEDGGYDLTSADTDNLIKVFKKVNASDSVTVVDLGDGKFDLKDGEDEYVIDTESVDSEEPVIESVDSNDDESADLDLSEEIEIEIEGDDLGEVGADEEGEGLVDEKAMTQSYSANRRVGVLSQTRAANAPGENKRDGALLVKNESKQIKSIKKIYASKLKEINEENEMLKNTLVMFKDKLKEQAVAFNSLGKYVKLVTENTTTKDEKVKILNRFANEAKTIEDGNKLYESLKKELNTKIIEGVKIDKQFNAEGSKKINESVIYQSPEINSTLSLMRRMNDLK